MGHGEARRPTPEEARIGWRTIASMRGPNAERAIRWLLISSSIVANLFGAAIVFSLLIWGLPSDRISEDSTTLTNLYATAGYVLLGAVFGTRWIIKRIDPARAWLIEERSPTEAEQRAMLRIPLTIFWSHAVIWGLAAVVFGLINATYSDELASRVAVTVVLGGLGTATFAYLLAERFQRPIAARALAERPPETPSVPGIKARMMIAWSLGAGLPTAGIVMVGLSSVTENDFKLGELETSAIVLGSLALILGSLAILLAVRAVADPVASVRAALAEVEAGNLDVSVPIYDGSEVGLLQSGFNRMVAGVREREELHDLFGRHVGEDVARAALEGGIEMGGETREVAVLFVDVVGSTKLASERSPAEVVEILNAFFAIVVDVVDEHGGWINKFVGDAALAIFGAPAELGDPAGRALAAGRELGERLGKELGEVEAGIGISYGPAVAGNIGEERRYEYTVIGDPVNEASRLSELAKTVDGRVLASARAIDAADDEAESWQLGDEVELRGRSEPTRLATPRS